MEQELIFCHMVACVNDIFLCAGRHKAIPSQTELILEGITLQALRIKWFCGAQALAVLVVATPFPFYKENPAKQSHL